MGWSFSVEGTKTTRNWTWNSWNSWNPLSQGSSIIVHGSNHLHLISLCQPGDEMCVAKISISGGLTESVKLLLLLLKLSEMPDKDRSKCLLHKSGIYRYIIISINFRCIGISFPVYEFPSCTIFFSRHGQKFPPNRPQNNIPPGDHRWGHIRSITDIAARVGHDLVGLGTSTRGPRGEPEARRLRRLRVDEKKNPLGGGFFGLPPLKNDGVSSSIKGWLDRNPIFLGKCQIHGNHSPPTRSPDYVSPWIWAGPFGFWMVWMVWFGASFHVTFHCLNGEYLAVCPQPEFVNPVLTSPRTLSTLMRAWLWVWRSNAQTFLYPLSNMV